MMLGTDADRHPAVAAFDQPPGQRVGRRATSRALTGPLPSPTEIFLIADANLHHRLGAVGGFDVADGRRQWQWQ